MKKQEKLRIDLTDEQKKKVENVIGRQPEAIELDVEELEERISPRMIHW